MRMTEMGMPLQKIRARIDAAYGGNPTDTELPPEA
jgi:hypothetical protein